MTSVAPSRAWPKLSGGRSAVSQEVARLFFRETIKASWPLVTRPWCLSTAVLQRRLVVSSIAGRVMKTLYSHERATDLALEASQADPWLWLPIPLHTPQDVMFLGVVKKSLFPNFSTTNSTTHVQKLEYTSSPGTRQQVYGIWYWSDSRKHMSLWQVVIQHQSMLWPLVPVGVEGAWPDRPRVPGKTLRRAGW